MTELEFWIYGEKTILNNGVSPKRPGLRELSWKGPVRGQPKKGPFSHFSFLMTTYQQSPFISATATCTLVQIWETQDMH